MRTLALVTILVLLAGCGADLKPAPFATTVAGLQDAARSSVQGVKMVAQAKGWPGPVEIKEEVTPVRVVVENNSGTPLRIAYDLFTLVGPDGSRFAALPLFAMEGEVDRAISPGFAPVADPMFGYTEFEVAPAYSSYYPGIPSYGGPYFYNSYYYGAYSPYLVKIELPTVEMARRAFPEGVLNSGGRLEGYLYFEKVSDDLPMVVFRADLVNAQSGKTFGEIRIPFVVE